MMEEIINKEEVLTQEILKELLYYDPLSGIFTWKERPIGMFTHCKDPQHRCNWWNSRFANKEAGTIWTSKKSKTSYLIIRISTSGKAKGYQAHRLAILYSDGHLPAADVDHIDRDGLNNRRINLREVSSGENHKNYPMPSTNTSGCVGITWNKKSQKWQAQIKVSGKNIYGGLFTKIEDAIAKREEMEIEYKFHKNHGRK